MIQKEIIATANCIDPVSDSESYFDFITISKDLRIEVISKLIGSMEDSSDTTKYHLSVDFCRKQSFSGQILETGKIEMNKSEKVECEDQGNKARPASIVLK